MYVTTQPQLLLRTLAITLSGESGSSVISIISSAPFSAVILDVIFSQFSPSSLKWPQPQQWLKWSG
jgi:hypothetical protein